MKIIGRVNSFGARLGTQTAEPGLTYMLNPCVIADGPAWYNPLTGEAVVVEDPKADFPKLVQKWFFVPQNFDIKSMTHWIRQKTLSDTASVGRTPKTSYTIFTTTACNASCSYCFEKGMETITMSDKTAEDVADYIIKTRNRNVMTTLKWFGGEPLVNMRAMNIISERLNRELIAYRGEITTNGSLLDKVPDGSMVDKWRLKNVQLTLDDIGSGYGEYKGLDDGAYARLKEQMLRLTGLGIHVAVRIHFHPEAGLEPCYQIVDDLKDIKNLSMYARIIYKAESIEDYERLLELEDYMVERGKYSYAFPRRGGGVHCMADNRRIACITPLGELSPCEHYAYGEVYGSIYNNEVDREMLAEWKAREKHLCTDCETCKLYPLCEKILLCPAEGNCLKGYMWYQIEETRRALREAAKKSGIKELRGATVEELAAMCGVC